MVVTVGHTTHILYICTCTYKLEWQATLLENSQWLLISEDPLYPSLNQLEAKVLKQLTHFPALRHSRDSFSSLCLAQDENVLIIKLALRK